MLAENGPRTMLAENGPDAESFLTMTALRHSKSSRSMRSTVPTMITRSRSNARLRVDLLVADEGAPPVPPLRPLPSTTLPLPRRPGPARALQLSRLAREPSELGSELGPEQAKVDALRTLVAELRKELGERQSELELLRQPKAELGKILRSCSAEYIAQLPFEDPREAADKLKRLIMFELKSNQEAFLVRLFSSPSHSHYNPFCRPGSLRLAPKTFKQSSASTLSYWMSFKTLSFRARQMKCLPKCILICLPCIFVKTEKTSRQIMSQTNKFINKYFFTKAQS